ncbi:uncharacterized protein LOC103955195 isoform X2 [Pyrus x bretschneideri]|uniref:uncharacterized protein LOC103955195 isoform X2 n=1 Tax=Pyrus x bretschneideri TaxID=225117 RepID=UPI00202DE03C|nr:uncharacterized protein LOC103955195 isoform X2 [Pyrus x bretschneideri]
MGLGFAESDSSEGLGLEGWGSISVLACKNFPLFRCMKATWSWSTVSSFTVLDDGSEPLAIPTEREVNNNKLRPQLCEGDMVLVDGSEALAILTEKEVNNNKKGLTRMPWLSSETWMSLRPPSLTTTLMEEERASRLFSTSSLTAETGRWMTSSAAIRFTRDSSRR